MLLGYPCTISIWCATLSLTPGGYGYDFARSDWSIQLDYWVTTWFRIYLNRDFEDPKQIIVQVSVFVLLMRALFN